MLKNLIKKLLLLLVIISLSHLIFSQKADSTKVPGYFGGAVTITNKGISMVPNLSLGKPAVIFDLSMGKRKLSFEPSFRFALEGKPWSFLFWWRYKLLQTDKFRITIGAHPALSFKTYSFLIDGVTEEHMVVRRYLAGELAPGYYLNMDNIDGSYINSTLTVARRNFPVSLSAMINQPIKTNITAGNEFLWNVSLIYSFNTEYLEK